MDASGGLTAAPTDAARPRRAVGLTAAEIAALVRSGEVSAVEVARAHLDRIAALDPRIDAFRAVREEMALAEAHAVDTALTRFALPLAGVPVAVKDNVAVRDEVITDGVAGRDAAPEPRHHPVVKRLRAAGAVIVGISRVPELCLYSATDGPGTTTRNPWDPARSSAGSSGGSAAAVAAGCVPIAHGNDGMGSLRLPAAACGLVTLKPGRGVVPAEIGADSWSGMAENGALATTVTDLALGHAVLAGTEPTLPEPPGRPLRIAVSTRSPLPGIRADPATLAAVDATVEALLAEGHIVFRSDPPVPPSAAVGAIARWMAGAADDVAHLGLDPRQLQPRSRTHVRVGRLARRAGLVRPGAAESYRARMVRFFAGIDLLLTPVTTGPPLAARPWHERSFAANVVANARWAPWAAAWNLAGLPALVLPVGIRPDGVPAAVQFAGPPDAEQRLLWLAGELERRAPWRRHAPPFDPTTAPVAAPADGT
jgi:amidase